MLDNLLTKEEQENFEFQKEDNDQIFDIKYAHEKVTFIQPKINIIKIIYLNSVRDA